MKKRDWMAFVALLVLYVNWGFLFHYTVFSLFESGTAYYLLVGGFGASLATVPYVTPIVVKICGGEPA